MTSRQFISSWDDGRRDDIRLAQLLLEYKIKAMFYIPGTTELTNEEITEIAKNFKVGSHTMSHPQDIKMLTSIQQAHQIQAGIDFLEPLVGYQPTAFCYPRGRYDLRTIEALKRCGVKTARTTEVGSLASILDQDPYRIKTTVHVYNRKEYGGIDWLTYARKMLQQWKKNGGLFHIWGHSWEIEKNHDWEKLEVFFKEVTE